jgi:HSP20 family protein
MAYRASWDPWQEVRRLQRDLEQLFERGTGSTPTGDYPPINMTHSPDGLVFVEVLCPGADKATLEVTVIGDTLTIKGERMVDAIGNDARYHRRQRPTGPFTRSVRLSERIDGDHVQATYANGILLVQLTSAPETTPKRIDIRS